MATAKESWRVSWKATAKALSTSFEGIMDGSFEGILEGECKGVVDGSFEGIVDGSLEGILEGNCEGIVNGFHCLPFDLVSLSCLVSTIMTIEREPPSLVSGRSANMTPSDRQQS
jgi:hypothetical protein